MVKKTVFVSLKCE